MLSGGIISARWWRLLTFIDIAIAYQVKAKRCPLCGARLDSGHYCRKGYGRQDEEDDPSCMRLSWCCSRDGCRHRVAPPSVRFWGRTVYIGPVVLALASEPWKSANGEKLRQLIGCVGVTWKRWLAKWSALWDSGIGRVLAGWMRLDAEQRSRVPCVMAQWSGTWPYQAAQWQLAIHQQTGGTSWESPSAPHRPLDPQTMSFDGLLLALQDVPRSF